MTTLTPCGLIANTLQEFLTLTRKQRQGRGLAKPTGATLTALQQAYGTFRSQLPGLLSVIKAKNAALAVAELDKINAIKLINGGTDPEIFLARWYYQYVNPICKIKLLVNGSFVIDSGRK